MDDDSIQNIQKELSYLCELFLGYVEKLYSEEKINMEEYNMMSEKKIEFLRDMNGL